MMVWKKWFSDEITVQMGILGLFFIGALHAWHPEVEYEPMANLIFGVYLMSTAITLATYKVKGQIKSQKHATYEELMGLAEKPKGRWEK